MTEQMEQMIYNEGYRRGKEETTTELMAWHDRVCEEMAKRHTADRPKGEWKWQRKIDGGLYHRCSECGYCDTERDFLTEYKFCPQCGADMRGADNE